MVPHISIHAFAARPEVLSLFQMALRDRRFARASCEVFSGGLTAAVQHYSGAKSPDIILLEASSDIVSELQQLADVCHADSKVIIIGHINDICVYRELLSQGVSEYLVYPVNSAELAGVIEGCTGLRDAAKSAKVYAFLGSNGGVGSSTAAQNIAWEMAGRLGASVLLIDLDLCFGSADLNLNVDYNSSFVDALCTNKTIDAALLDKLLVKRGKHLHILTHPLLLEHPPEFLKAQIAQLLSVARSSFSYIVLDLPNQWSAHVRDALLESDEVILTSMPDLSGIRNAKALCRAVSILRPNDKQPILILNQVGLPKRKEIKSQDFVRALGLDAWFTIPFDTASFSDAAAAGQMLSEIHSKSAASRIFEDLATKLADIKQTQPTVKLRPRLPKFSLKRKTS